MKKKSAVIIVLAVVLIFVTGFAFNEIMKNRQDSRADGSIKKSETAGEGNIQPAGDIEKGGSQAPSEYDLQPSGDTEEGSTKAPGESSSQAGGLTKPEGSFIEPEDGKKLIGVTADLIVQAIADKDFEIVSEYTHPELGVRFTPYTFVSVESDLVFGKNEIKYFFDDEKAYLWGYYDGSGFEINLTAGEYYEKFIYPADYVNAPEIGYNEVLSFGNMTENQFEVYKDAIIVEYYYPSFEPQYEGLDWRSLRLVFQQYNGEWKLTGLINNQWTI